MGMPTVEGLNIHCRQIYTYVYIYMAANQKRGVGSRLGRPFRDIGLQQTGVFCDKPLSDKPPKKQNVTLRQCG